jgi:hypothetical protein
MFQAQAHKMPGCVSVNSQTRTHAGSTSHDHLRTHTPPHAQANIRSLLTSPACCLVVTLKFLYKSVASVERNLALLLEALPVQLRQLSGRPAGGACPDYLVTYVSPPLPYLFTCTHCLVLTSLFATHNAQRTTHNANLTPARYESQLINHPQSTLLKTQSTSHTPHPTPHTQPLPYTIHPTPYTPPYTLLPFTRHTSTPRAALAKLRQQRQL